MGARVIAHRGLLTHCQTNYQSTAQQTYPSLSAFSPSPSSCGYAAPLCIGSVTSRARWGLVFEAKNTTASLVFPSFHFHLHLIFLVSLFLCFDRETARSTHGKKILGWSITYLDADLKTTTRRPEIK